VTVLGGSTQGGSPGSSVTLPQWDDPAWWSRYWDDVRPRFVLVRIRAERIHLRWGMPLWAVEESLRLVLLALPWVAYAWRWLPERWRAELARPDRRIRIAIEPTTRPPWHTLVALLQGHGEGMLRMERGLPFVQVEAASGRGLVHVEVTQV
jgi:hypothetical protein